MSGAAFDIAGLLAPRGTLFGLVLLRAVPFIGYVVASVRFSAGTKYLAVVASGIWLLLTLRFDPLAKELVVYAPLLFVYFVVAVIFSIAMQAKLTQCGKLAAFVVLFGLFVVGPSVLPIGHLRSFAIVAGSEMLLASFSVHVDGYRGGAGPKFADHAFFVLVNPVLVYAERGRVTGVCRPSALSRCAFGVMGLHIGASVSRAAAAFGITPAGPATPLACLLLFLAAYAKHSALASLQIGFMRFAGHEVPERYAYPLTATSCVEFWRRWNTYFGSWARRYVFNPIALWSARTRKLSAGQTKGLAAVSTFGSIGLLHDLATMLTTLDCSWRWSVFFLWQAVALVVWQGVRPPTRHFARSNGRRALLPLAGGWAITMAILVSGATLMSVVAKQ